MRWLSRFGIAVLLSLFVSSLIAYAGYALRIWPGFQYIIYCSVPLALLLGVAAVLGPRQKLDQKSFSIVSVLIGAGLGAVYALAAYARFSHAPVAFIVLIVSCWVASGIAAMAAVNSRKHLQTSIGIAVLCLTVISVMEPIFNVIAHNQQLTVAFLTPSEISTTQLKGQPETLGFNDDQQIEFAKNEVFERVRALGLIEAYRILSITRQGKGKKSLAIFVVRTPVTKEVVFPVPDSSTVAYVQHSGNWEEKPAQVPALKRGIKLWGWSDANRSYLFEIPDAKGSGIIGRIKEENVPVNASP